MIRFLNDWFALNALVSVFKHHLNQIQDEFNYNINIFLIKKLLYGTVWFILIKLNNYFKGKLGYIIQGKLF